LTGGSDSAARIWNASTGEALGTFRHDTGCWGTFSPDGSLIVTAGTDRNARLWDVQTRTPRGPPLKHEVVVSGAVFSRDGRMILTGSLDRTARLWDVTTGKQLGPSMQHAGDVIRVGFGPEGTAITSEESFFPPSSPPGPAHFWTVPNPPGGADDQIELWTQVMTGMELDEIGGVHLLEVNKWQARSTRLRDSGFAFDETSRKTKL
jgi:WD40 repeat protein